MFMLKQDQKIMILVVIFLFSTLPLITGVPSCITYQGRLLDPPDEPLNADVSITFAIYADSTGGISLWTETQDPVSVIDGLFQVKLGSVTPLPDELFNESERWLGLNVEGDGEMSPRTQILSAAYALNARDVYDEDINPNSINIEGYGAVINSSGEWVGETLPAAGSDKQMIYNNNGSPAGADVYYDNASGNIGIGTTSPDATLSLGTNNVLIRGSGSVGVESDIYFDQNGGMAAEKGLNFFIDADNDETNNAFHFRKDGENVLDPNVTELMTIKENGNIGFGNTDPNQSLVIGNDFGVLSGKRIIVGDDEAGTLSGIVIGENADNRGWLVWSVDNDNFGIGTRNSGTTYNTMNFTSGNVGIGTTSPSEKLDVNGTIEMTGFKLPTGASNNYVLTSDTNGNGTWQESTEGDITSVTAGTGLTGGGDSGDVTLNVDFAGTGSDSTASRSDHNHDATYVNEGQTDAITTAMLQDNAVKSAKILNNTIQRDDVTLDFKSPYADSSDFATNAAYADSSGNSQTSASLELPYIDSASSDSSVVILSNTGNGAGVTGVHETSENYGSLGSFQSGVYGQSFSNAGLMGFSSDGYGVSAMTDNGLGVYGVHNSSGNYGSIGNVTSGVSGNSTSGSGVSGTSTGGFGVYGTSSNLVGVQGSHTESGNYGNLGNSTAGVFGYSEEGYGVHGTGPNAYGTLGVNVWGSYYGVSGFASSGVGAKGASNTGTGVYGTSDDGDGVYGRNSNSGNWGSLGSSGEGVWGYSTDEIGVFGTSTNGHGVYGFSNFLAGVHGETNNSSGIGVYGENTNSGNYGTIGSSDTGVSGTSTNGYGIYGTNTSSGNFGYLGSGSYGVYGNGTYNGVRGAGGEYGVYGYGDEIGVYGFGDDYGVYGYCPISGFAGYFNNNVHITGTLTKGAGSFLIDHPLDPENKLLRHSFVESPENLLIYRGKVSLDENGEAIVEMPDYFIALTKEDEASIHLTPVGRPFLTGAEWNKGFRSFTVYGDADRDVFWEVLVDRDDPVIKELGRPVVEEKGPDNKFCDRGELLYPTAYGYSESMGKDYEEQERNRKEMEKVESLRKK